MRLGLLPDLGRNQLTLYLVRYIIGVAYSLGHHYSAIEDTDVAYISN